MWTTKKFCSRLDSDPTVIGANHCMGWCYMVENFILVAQILYIDKKAVHIRIPTTMYDSKNWKEVLVFSNSISCELNK